MAEPLPTHLKLEIVTPSEQLFSGEVDMVTVPGMTGYLGILPGHAALLSELKPGVLSYRTRGVVRKLFCGWGFVEVLPDRVSVLTDQAELPEQVDTAEAERLKIEAELQLRGKDPDTDFAKALAVWEAAVARLEVGRGF